MSMVVNSRVVSLEDMDLVGVAGVDVAGFSAEEVSAARGLGLELVKGALVELGDWIFGGGKGKAQGVMIRAHIAFWDLLPHLRCLKQTELAELMGLKHKQSVGREVSDFRDRFGIRNGHMQCEEAREVCREREARKGKGTEETKVPVEERCNVCGRGLRREDEKKVGACVGCMNE